MSLIYVIITDCNGKPGWFRTAVVGTEENDIIALVYVKGYQKWEWLKDMLESDARDDIIIETLDAHYEDIESLNNLDVIKCI